MRKESFVRDGLYLASLKINATFKLHFATIKQNLS